MIKILEFNKSFMINWVELDMLLSIVNPQGNMDIRVGMFKVRKILEEVSEKEKWNLTTMDFGRL